MLMLGIVAAPSVGLEALQRPHCIQHGVVAARGGHHAASERQAPGRGSPSWRQAGNHECPHCPATECARVSPCTGSTTTALSPAAVAVTYLTGHRVALDLVRDQASSAQAPPDTPPPQLIA